MGEKNNKKTSVQRYTRFTRAEHTVGSSGLHTCSLTDSLTFWPLSSRAFREKMESQLEKEARFCQLMAHSSHDSAIDTESLEWETEVVEFEKDRVRMPRHGSRLAGCHLLLGSNDWFGAVWDMNHNEW